MRILLVFLFCFCLLDSQFLLAQYDQTPNYGQGEPVEQNDSLSVLPDLALDTFNFHFLYPHNIDQEYPYQDTSIELFQNYDPARQQQWDYATIGNLGGAHFPFVYQPRQRRGFDIGFHQFDLYKTEYEDFAFFRLRKAFTRLHFTQGKTQQDTYSQALFSRNFSKGINFTLDFKRINHTGQFQNQKAENTSLAFGFWYKSPGQQYDAFISYISNGIFQEENGGIDISTINPVNIQEAFSVPVQLGNNVANTAHTERAFHFHQRFLFNKQKAPKKKGPVVEPYLLPDSTRSLVDSLTLDSLTLGTLMSDSLTIDSLTIDSLTLNSDSITLDSFLSDSISIVPSPSGSIVANRITTDSLQNDSLSFGEPILLDSLGFPIPDSLLIRDSIQQTIYEAPSVFKKRKRDYAFSHHGTFQVAKYKFADTSPAADSSYYGNLQKENRGLRYFIRNRKLENTFTLNTTKVVKKGEGSTKQQKDFFEVGIRHSLHFLHQEARDTTIKNLFLQGSWNIAPTKRLNIKTYADLGLIDNAGDYHLHVDLFFDLQKAGQVKARVAHQSYSPNLMEYQHLLSQQVVWKNDFDKTFETNISLIYSLPRFNLALIGEYHLLNNYTFYNADGFAEQYNSPLSIGQLTLKKKFSVWKIHLNNQVTLQQISKNVIRLPELYSLHSLYYDDLLFNDVLSVQIGIDLRLNTPYDAMGYQPSTGQFFLAPYENGDTVPYTYLDLDVFVNFRVKTFRFFVKQENLLQYFSPDYYYDFHYQIKDYALPYAYLRFGVSWQFLD
ncbi:MAG: hypothetical protein ACJATF_000083 [Flavobacteriales bacterium]|jgi:hypothetical protein